MAKITVDLDALDDQEIINEEALLTEEDLKKPTSSDLSKFFGLICFIFTRLSMFAGRWCSEEATCLQELHVWTGRARDSR
jgi:hypothetical protein